MPCNHLIMYQQALYIKKYVNKTYIILLRSKLIFQTTTLINTKTTGY